MLSKQELLKYRHTFTQEDRARGGRATRKKEKPFFFVTRQLLSQLFQVTPRTISSWIARKVLDPYSIEDIVLKYNNRHLLDRRRNPPPEPGA